MYKRNKKFQPKTILLDDRYPIGHGTGLNEKEWREFAKNYVPMDKRTEEE